MKNIMIIIMLSLVCLFFSGCSFYISVGKYSDSDKYLVGDQEYSGELVELDIDWVSGTVELIEDSSAEAITLKEETDYEAEELKVRSYFSDGKLLIKFGKSGYRGKVGLGQRKYLEIRYKDVSKIKVNLTSGSLKAESITCDSLDLDMTSGEVVINKLSCDSAEIDLSSGKVNIEELVCNNLDCDMTSGKCVISVKTLKEGSFDMTSGRVTLTIPSTFATKVKFAKTTGRLKTDKTFTRVANEYIFGDIGSEVESNIKVNITSGTFEIK